MGKASEIAEQPLASLRRTKQTLLAVRADAVAAARRREDAAMAARHRRPGERRGDPRVSREASAGFPRDVTVTSPRPSRPAERESVVGRWCRATTGAAGCTRHRARRAYIRASFAAVGGPTWLPLQSSLRSWDLWFPFPRLARSGAASYTQAPDPTVEGGPAWPTGTGAIRNEEGAVSRRVLVGHGDGLVPGRRARGTRTARASRSGTGSATPTARSSPARRAMSRAMSTTGTRKTSRS